MREGKRERERLCGVGERQTVGAKIEGWQIKDRKKKHEKDFKETKLK